MLDDDLARTDARGVHEWEGLYREHRDAVLAVCRRILRDPSDAEDALQETFARALRTPADAIESPANRRKWLAQVARRVCIDRLRAPRRSHEAGPEVAITEVAATTDEHARVEDRIYVSWLLSHLSPRERSALTRHHLLDEPLADVAEGLGISYSSTLQLVSRARRRVVSIVGLAVGGAAGFVAALRLRAQRAAGRLGGSAGDGVLGTLTRLDVALPIIVVLVGISPALRSDSDSPGPLRAAPSAPAAPAAASPDAAVAMAGGAVPVPRALPAAQAPAASPATPAWVISTPSAPARPTSVTDPGQLAGGLAAPGSHASIEDVGVTSMAVTQGGGSQDTAYAVGTLVSGCARRVVCPALFATTDGGASWQHRSATGLVDAGKLLIAQDDVSGGVLYVASADSLEVSHDRGASFTPIAPGAAVAAISEPGDPRPRIVFGLRSLWVYDITSGGLTPGPALPAGLLQLDDLALTPEGSMVVAARVPRTGGAPGATSGVIVLCDAAGCSDPVTVDSAPLVRATVVGSAVVAAAQDGLFVSADGGRSFVRSFTPRTGRIVDAVALATTGRQPVAVVLQSPDGQTGSILTGSLDGTGFRPDAAPLPSPPVPIDHLASLGDGHIVGSVPSAWAAGRSAVLCVVAGEWHAGCAAH